MSSEPEEGADNLDEPNANSDINENPSEDQKGNGLKEHAKPRRRRRGKKRKQRKESAATSEAENPEVCESELLHAESEHENHGDCDSPEWGCDESLSCNYDGYTDIIIRPVNVPMAPLNSTQFIMDDHDDCRFYMSFETPNPYGGRDSINHGSGDEGDIVEQIGEDAAYIDIDYQYESPQDFDNSAYYDKEFELSYKNNRFEELMRLTRNDLINRLQTLESRFKELNEDLVKENPSPILEKLQAELLELQEKNIYLKECNSKLSSELHEEEPECSVSLTRNSEEHRSPIHGHQSDDSEREVFEECNEVIMLDAKPESDETLNNACDTNSDVQLDDCEPDTNNKQFSVSEELNELANHDEDSNQLFDQQVGKKKRELKDKNVLSSSPESEDCTLSGRPVVNSEDKKSKLIQSNSHARLYQPNNLVNDDLRTLNITSSEIFHINQTTCSSSVPREGGMSPSETSVN